MSASISPAWPLAADACAPALQRAEALDDPAEWSSFSRPLPGAPGRWESYLAIEGMHCAACTLAVEQALGALPGVASVQVNGATQTARLTWSDAAGRPSQWLAALRRAGYGALPAGDVLQAAPRRREQRMMLWRWLVAGFCMMQAMMYALPLYLAAPGEMTPDIAALLRWGAWMMTLPVILFSCQPFFRGAWRDLRGGRIGMDVPVALGIGIAFAASTAATFDPGGPWGREVWYDSVTMFVFFLLSGRLLEQRLRHRSAGALEALLRTVPASVEREDAAGRFERVPVRALRVGDRIRVLAGEAFPADGCVEQGDSRVDEALLTGEWEPQPRGVGDAVIAGSHNLAASVLVRVQRLGKDTRHAEIVALMERAAVEKPRLAQLADRIAPGFLVSVLGAAALAAAWWWSAGAAHALSVAVAVLVVTCPCALSLATPAATLASAGALARRGVLVRRPQALHDAAMVDTVLFDKTGTLTQDALVLSEIRCRPGADRSQALALAVGLAQHSLHPLSRALCQAREGGSAASPRHSRESGNPRASWAPVGPGFRRDDGVCEVHGVHEHAGGGLVGVDGQGRALRLGSAAFCGLPEQGADGPQVHLADAGGWLASFAFSEALRPDAVAAVEALRRRGLRLQLLSGDRPEAVRRLAQRLGIGEWQAGCTPEDKLARLQALQSQGHRVAMVGDGMNDGPVLARAELSLAMGRGVPLAQSKADVVLQGSRLVAVAELFERAAATRRIVRQNLLWAAVYNAACVPLAMAGFMPPWLAGLGMAASSLGVVANSARLGLRK